MGERSSEQVLGMRIVLIGAGRLATNLGRALHTAGHDIVAVYSRTMESAQVLAEQISAQPTNQIADLPATADAFIVAVKDAVLCSLIPLLTKGREDQVFFHTAGSMPMAVFEGMSSHYGVFYPMQSFSKERQVDFSVIPTFIEASDPSTLVLAHLLAGTITNRIFELSSEDRRYLHLSAVFACNFVNHCYTLSAELLERHHLPFEVMLPLIDETAQKVHEMHPLDAQTGPAVRYDENVIHMQAELLADMPEMQDIYEKLSVDIHRKARKEI